MKRAAPNPEFVLMYRKGIPTSRIAALEASRRPPFAITCELLPAPSLAFGMNTKQPYPPPAPRTPEAGLRNLTDVIAFYESEGRLPVAHGKSAKERALGAWLVKRRREAAQGTLSPIYRETLGVIPGWDKPSTRKVDDEARWQQRLEELQKIRTAGGDWPRHQKTDDIPERTLGVWLHGQRIDYRAGRLSPAKEKKLNKALPGWREGRGHRGGRRANLGQKPFNPDSGQL